MTPERQREMISALKAVEEWWLSEGMKHFNGAPYAIFAVRSALAFSSHTSAISTPEKP